MKVDGPSRVGAPALKKRERSERGDKASFTFARETAEPPSPSAVGSSSPLTGLDAILTLQELPAEQTARAKGLRRAESLLDHLEDVRIGLLVGAIPESRLESLLVLVRRHDRHKVDNRLAELLDDIELRASVELAKLGRDV